MNVKRTFVAVLIIVWLSALHTVYAASDSDAFLDMSLEELAGFSLSGIGIAHEERTATGLITRILTVKHIQALGAEKLWEVLNTLPEVIAELKGPLLDYLAGMYSQSPDKPSLVVLLNGKTVKTVLTDALFSVADMSTKFIRQIEVIQSVGSPMSGENSVITILNIITQDEKDTEFTS